MLDFRRPFRGQPVTGAVQMRLEGHPVLVEAAQRAERHHLKAAGVGQQRAVPSHHLAHAAKPAHAFRPRAQHQVIGVGKNDAGARRPHRFRHHALDRGGRADRHEDRRLDIAPGCLQAAAPCRTVGRLQREIEIRHCVTPRWLRPAPQDQAAAGRHRHRKRNDIRRQARARRRRGSAACRQRR